MQRQQLHVLHLTPAAAPCSSTSAATWRPALHLPSSFLSSQTGDTIPCLHQPLGQLLLPRCCWWYCCWRTCCAVVAARCCLRAAGSGCTCGTARRSSDHHLALLLRRLKRLHLLWRWSCRCCSMNLHRPAYWRSVSTKTGCHLLRGHTIMQPGDNTVMLVSCLHGSSALVHTGPSTYRAQTSH